MNDLLQEVLTKLRVERQKGDEYICWCPFHPDGQGKPPHQPNLSVSERGFICFACGEKGSLKKLAHHLGIEVEMEDKRPITIYDYKDEKGILLFQILRYPGKKFSARRPDGLGGWIWDTKGIKLVPYRLPELLANDLVFICEGEKDCDNLHRLGLIATTNSFGSNSWKSEFNPYFRGKKVIILPDQDEEGQKHAQAVASSLLPFAQEVKILNLPGLEEKQDVSDWLAQGNTKDDLLRLVESTQTRDKAEKAPLAVSIQEFMDSGPDSIEWLCPDLIPQGGLVILAAKPKAGKSLLTTNLALAVVGGIRFLGRDCKKANSLILQLEDPPVLIRERLKKMGVKDGHN